ncbi:hypothetical protein AB1Y20_010060 [Prymnesium parvum]|uniref:Nucleotide-diphospho-sugar transferase domain-containing protein n=1 Tax=Prymnesium parvum TaxID=97485 RepID=A0AB34K5T2_PRYPA
MKQLVLTQQDISLALGYTPEATRASCAARARATSAVAPSLPARFHSKEHLRAQVTLRRARLEGGDARLVPWFTTMAPPLRPDDVVGQRFISAAKVSIFSALVNAPSLVPYLLYYGHRDSTSLWMEAHGVKVMHVNLTFWEALPEHQRTQRQSNGNVFATYGKIDVPRLVDAAGAAHPTGMVLYTDLDVIFMRDLPISALPLSVRYMAATKEPLWNIYNTGVLWMNASSMTEQHARMVEYARRRRFHFTVYEQTWLNNYFKKLGWDQLPGRLNVAPFMDCNGLSMERRSSSAHVESLLCAEQDVVVWHFAGVKPWDVECWVQEIRVGDMNFSSCKLKPTDIADRWANHKPERVAKLDQCLTPKYVQVLALWNSYLQQVNNGHAEPVLEL